MKPPRSLPKPSGTKAQPQKPLESDVAAPGASHPRRKIPAVGKEKPSPKGAGTLRKSVSAKALPSAPSSGPDVGPSTRGVRTGGRSARVVTAVLEAALQELSSCGYGAFCVEAVAHRAHVAKTTIYRRWPLKIDLVRAAILQAMTDEFVDIPDTGTLDGDLLAYLRATARTLGSPRGSSIWRMLWAEAEDPDVAAIKRAIRSMRRAIPDRIIARAVARSEIPADTDPDLLFQVPIAAVCHRRFFAQAPIDDRYLKTLVDVVVGGLRLLLSGARV